MGMIGIVALVVISAVAVIVIAYLMIIVEPYFRIWLERKLDRIFVPKHCSYCRYCAENWRFYPPRYHCNANDKEVMADSSCDKWERR